MNLSTGQSLRILRIAHGMSQSDVASYVGITNEYLSRIERDKTPLKSELMIQLVLAITGCAGDLREEAQRALREARETLGNALH